MCGTRSVRARWISRVSSLASLPDSSTRVCCATAIGETGEPGSYEEQAANPAGMEDGMTENPRSRYKVSPGRTLSMPLVRFEHLGNMARIILAGPNAGNAINAALIADLSAAVDAVRACEPRSVLITAEGANFSSGGDLKHLLAAGGDVAAELDWMAHGFHAAQLRLIGIGVPIVGAARGNVIGGGFGLALSSDYLLCSGNSCFSTGYSRPGLSADAGVSYFLTPALVRWVRGAP